VTAAALTLLVSNVAAATGGRILAGNPAAPLGRVVIDSRAVGSGDCFVAIRGERLDGHAFVKDALAAGASSVIVQDAASVEGTAATIIQVNDTTVALQALARHVRRESGAQVVAITGSAGKTTTKEICAEFLSARYGVFRNKGNLNNHIGLPLSLLELRSRPDVAVVELGMNHPGEIRALVGIAEPNVRVWTNVGDAHLGFFPSADAIADAKAEILEQASASDLLVANLDDGRIASRMGAFPGRRVTFGTGHGADVRATGVEFRGLDGVRARVDTPRGSFALETPLLGSGNLYNVLAATAVAVTLGVEAAQIGARARALRPAYHRGELLRLPGGVTLIDDSYNSSPAALKTSLEIVRAASGSARKIAVLGEMLELGDHATELHRACGRAAQAAGVDVLIVAGGRPARALADEARAAGMAAASVVVADDKVAAGEALRQVVRPGDLVLVKGSRGIGLDQVVDMLKAEFA
jgi:UDP-N-acetylmuramoyl-tripeptide--D-alanyl-D-alanine ligase